MKFENLLLTTYRNLKKENRLTLERCDLKTLFTEMKKLEPKITLKDFKEKLWKLHKKNPVKWQLERCPIIVPFTIRYGIHSDRGIYNYFTIDANWCQIKRR